MTPDAKFSAVVIGASAGAIGALSRILPVLPADYPLPIFIVVHIPSETDSLLPELFQPKCRLKIKEAEDKEHALPGFAYFAPPDYHLLIEDDGTLSLSGDEPELFSRPSINVLFESAADAYGDGVVCVVLTGASSDGAHGARLIGDSGGLVLVQDPEEAEMTTMPSAALQACASARALSLDAIVEVLRELPKQMTAR